MTWVILKTSKKNKLPLKTSKRWKNYGLITNGLFRTLQLFQMLKSKENIKNSTKDFKQTGKFSKHRSLEGSKTKEKGFWNSFYNKKERKTLKYSILTI